MDWIEVIILLILGTLAGFAGGTLSAYIILRKTSPHTLSLKSPPSKQTTPLRSKKRYIVFEALGVEPVTFEELKSAVEEEVRKAYGEIGEALYRIKLVEYNESRRRGILRVRRDYKMQALAILGLIRNLNGKKLLLAPLATTGSLRRARGIVES